MLLFLVSPPWGCSSLDRELDPAHPEPVRATMKLVYEPGLTPPEILDRVSPGDILAFRARESSSDGSVMLAAAIGGYTHVAIAFALDRRTVRVLTADSERGVTIETIGSCVRGRKCYVYAFPEGTVSLGRLKAFALRAEFIGDLDYDWSAVVLGWNSNLTPNSVDEIAGEHTCATAVAAALHFSGLSLDRAHLPWQYVSPEDIIFSPARRNLNFARTGGGGGEP